MATYRNKMSTPKKITCPECGCSLNSKNLEKHLMKVHGIRDSTKPVRRGRNANERLEHLQKQQRKTMIGVAIFVCIVLAIGSYFIFFNDDDSGDTPYIYNLKENDGFVYVDQSDVGGGEVHYFKYNAENYKEVEYFLVEDNNGDIRGAVNLCANPHPTRSGWIQDGYVVICEFEKCAYPIYAIGTDQAGCGGGCVPVELPFELKGDEVLIPTESLEEVSQYF